MDQNVIRNLTFDEAKILLLSKKLGDDFSQWDLADNRGETVAHVAARVGYLPVTFHLWNIADKKGLSVAHTAAQYGHLPIDFDQWGLARKDGCTVAHVAAWCGCLPTDFNQWDLADNDGWTVAHEAAKFMELPFDFNQWGLIDDNGLSVLRRFLQTPNISDKFMERWRAEKPLCKAEADWGVFKTELPELYSKYTVIESFDDMDAAHEVHLL
jgi:hypothetical protein